MIALTMDVLQCSIRLCVRLEAVVAQVKGDVNFKVGYLYIQIVCIIYYVNYFRNDGYFLLHLLCKFYSIYTTVRNILVIKIP